MSKATEKEFEIINGVKFLKNAKISHGFTSRSVPIKSFLEQRETQSDRAHSYESLPQATNSESSAFVQNFIKQRAPRVTATSTPITRHPELDEMQFEDLFEDIEDSHNQQSPRSFQEKVSNQSSERGVS